MLYCSGNRTLRIRDNKKATLECVERSFVIDFSIQPIFRGVSGESLALLTTDMMRYFRTGDTIVREDQDGRELIVLLDGEAQVFARGTFLVSRKAGEVIGEQAIIDGTVRSATVVAQGMVQVLMVPENIVNKLMKDVAFVMNLARILSAKLRAATSVRSIRYRNEERLFGEFSAHVAPELASRLLAEGTSYGNPRFQHVALLLVDIRSFTETCAGMSPAQIGSELSTYLGSMVDVLFRHGAFVDKFIGDAILAVWGVTPSEGNHASRAFSCAIEMVEHAAALRFGGKAIRVGAGLNAGSVFVGNVGSDQKRQFTVLGAPVNLTARLESECKPLAASIVMGKDFYNLLPSDQRVHLREHSDRDIRGAGKQTVYSWSPGEAEVSRVLASGKEDKL